MESLRGTVWVRFYEKTVDNGYRMPLYFVTVRDDYSGGKGYCPFNRVICTGVVVDIVYPEPAKKKATFEKNSCSGSLFFMDCLFGAVRNPFRCVILSRIHSPDLSL